jgi:hypothetical protein
MLNLLGSQARKGNYEHTTQSVSLYCAHKQCFHTQTMVFLAFAPCRLLHARRRFRGTLLIGLNMKMETTCYSDMSVCNRKAIRSSNTEGHNTNLHRREISNFTLRSITLEANPRKSRHSVVWLAAPCDSCADTDIWEKYAVSKS